MSTSVHWIGAAVWGVYAFIMMQVIPTMSYELAVVVLWISLAVVAVIGYINVRIDYGDYYRRYVWRLKLIRDMVVVRMWGPIAFIGFSTLVALDRSQATFWACLSLWFLGHWLIGSFRPVDVRPVTAEWSDYPFAHEINAPFNSAHEIVKMVRAGCRTKA